MRPGKRFTLADLRCLQPGDRVYVVYQDPSEEGRLRLDGVFTVFQTDSEMLMLQDENGIEEFPWKDWDADNVAFDDGEGIAVISSVRG